MGTNLLPGGECNDPSRQWMDLRQARPQALLPDFHPFIHSWLVSLRNSTDAACPYSFSGPSRTWWWRSTTNDTGYSGGCIPQRTHRLCLYPVLHCDRSRSHAWPCFGRLVKRSLGMAVDLFPEYSLWNWSVFSESPVTA